MRTQVGDELAWRVVLAADKAHLQQREARNELEDYKRLSALSLKGVHIDPGTYEEVESRETTASAELSNILKIAGILEIKKYDPNPVPVVRTPSEEKQPALARELHGELILLDLRSDREPGIDATAFRAVAQTLQSDLDRAFVDRAFKLIVRRRDVRQFLIEKSDEPVMPLAALDELIEVVNQPEGSPQTQKFGPATLGVFNLVSQFVVTNKEALLGVPQE